MQNVNASRLETLVRAAAQARQAGDFAKALAFANQAASERLAHPLLLRVQAEALAVAGRYGEAGQVLNRALALAPNDPLTITDIGRVLVAENRLEEAVRAFEAALAVQPGLAAAWLELGSARDIVGDDAGARAAYEQVRSLVPGGAEAWAALATIALRHGDVAQARQLAEEAIRRQPDHPGASLVLASAEVERDETVRANAARFGDGGRIESHLELVLRLTRWFERQDPADWRERTAPDGAASPVRRHVFLLGYPRSGNTLVENILASLPDVRALEERPTLADSDLAFLRDDGTLDQLAHLDPALAERQREAYWRRVRAEVPDVDGKVFVDMAPLNGIKLPMIARLFPDAVVVLCRRDPRDVVLSCFRRHFRVNASTYQMTGLERAARHYDAVMRLVELYLAVLPLPVHVVHYAALVADFDASTRALTEFVGVPWTEAVREFSRTAATRDVRTVSATQVRRGLFDGTRQWERYREQMAPVLPVLDPWVKKFGYAD